MSVTVRSFAKINLGLSIGALRPDGFHDLRTVYQTIGSARCHSRAKLGAVLELRFAAKTRVFRKIASNTCYRIVERAMAALRARGRVTVTIEKRLPVQGGLGAGSGNASRCSDGARTGAEEEIAGSERLRIAAEVGSDLPLFLVGGTVLGVGHGEEVYPLPDLAGHDLRGGDAGDWGIDAAGVCGLGWDDRVGAAGESCRASLGPDGSETRPYTVWRWRQIDASVGLR